MRSPSIASLDSPVTNNTDTFAESQAASSQVSFNTTHQVQRLLDWAEMNTTISDMQADIERTTQFFSEIKLDILSQDDVVKWELPDLLDAAQSALRYLAKRMNDIAHMVKSLVSNSQFHPLDFYQPLHDLKSSLTPPIACLDVLMPLLPDSTSRSFQSTIGVLRRVLQGIIVLTDYVGKYEQSTSAFAPTLSIQSCNLKNLVNGVIGKCSGANTSASKIVFDCNISSMNGVDLDTDKLESILHNLITNAQKYGDFSAENNTITVRLSQNSNDCIIEVINPSKEPLSPEIQSRMWQRGYSSNPDGLSNGLGLDIVQQYVRAHGGTVSVCSVDLQTVFQVRIPYTARVHPAA